VEKQLAVQKHLALGRLLQRIDAPDKRTLSRPGRPNDSYFLPCPDMEVYILQSLKLTERLANPF
jgi:hypothetical protein